MAVAPNQNPLVSGYFDAWVYIKLSNNKKNAFNQFYNKNEIIKVPVAHGEGRFITKDRNLINKLEKNKQIIFKYCNEKGKIENKYPINPNGAIDNIAAISNKKGNVMAIMPHPERASYNSCIHINIYASISGFFLAIVSWKVQDCYFWFLHFYLLIYSKNLSQKFSKFICALCE